MKPQKTKGQQRTTAATVEIRRTSCLFLCHNTLDSLRGSSNKIETVITIRHNHIQSQDITRPYDYSNIFKQTYSNIFKHIQTYSNIFKHIQTYSNIFKHIQCMDVSIVLLGRRRVPLFKGYLEQATGEFLRLASLASVRRFSLQAACRSSFLHQPAFGLLLPL